MRQLALSVGLIWATSVAGFEIEDQARFGPDATEDVIHIISTADIAYFAPMIESYIDENPDVAVEYVVASSTELVVALQEEIGRFDLVISSAMDLQTKLANDGRAQRHFSSATEALPDWAVWNDMLFAFTQEAAAIVVSNAAFQGLEIPTNRQELISVLRQNPDRFRGRIGTYDIRQSGLGYLFATQDTRASDTYWRLTEVMGGLDARLYCCSSQMIDAVEQGDLAVAYNVLGSYAANREDTGRFTIILPTDFTTVMQRTVLIPSDAPDPETAGEFVDHMLEVTFGGGDGQPLARDAQTPTAESSLHRIQLGPGLLVFLDQLKQGKFVSEWESAILQNNSGTED